jgi:hypothetical protein
MSDMLFDLHLDRDQKWRWFGVRAGSPMMIVSRRAWDERGDAALAATRFVQLISRTMD